MVDHDLGAKVAHYRTAFLCVLDGLRCSYKQECETRKRTCPEAIGTEMTQASKVVIYEKPT